MGDLMSKNYNKQTSVRYFFNPIRVIYFIESFLKKKYEKFCFKKI